MRTKVNTLRNRTEYVMTEAELKRYRYQVIKQYKADRKEKFMNIMSMILKWTLITLSAFVIALAFVAFVFLNI